MKATEQDRRTLKTNQAIQDALFSLMLEKQYSKITIQDIIDRANVGRSTFYAHFTTKDDLLLGSIKHLLNMFNDYVIHLIEDTDNTSQFISFVGLFEHIQENGRVMRGLIRSESTSLFFDQIQTYWNKKIEEYLNTKVLKEKKIKVPTVILANHISSTLIYLMKWWVNNKMPYSPSEMDQYFQELIKPCIQSIISE